MVDQYEFKTAHDIIVGELIGETDDAWIVKLENDVISSIRKNDIVDCRIKYPRHIGTFEEMQTTIQNMIAFNM